MATVTINNNFKDSMTFQLEVTGTTAKTFQLTANQVQDYKVTINSGTPFEVIGSGSNVLIPYQAGFSGEVLNIELEAINGSALANITAIAIVDAQTGTIITTSTLFKVPNLTSLNLSGGNRKTNLIGSVSELPTGLTFLQAGGQLNGLISDLPNSLLTFAFLNVDANQANSITGSLADLPSGLTSLLISDQKGAVVFTGSTADLPSTLSILSSGLNGVIDFSVNTLPPNITLISLFNYAGDNLTLSGDINNIPNTCTYFYCGKSISNTLTGNITNLPPNITQFNIAGSISDTNTISGNIQDIPASLTYIQILGNNTIGGNIGLAPFSGFNNNVLIYGNNTISGNIDEVNASFSNLRIEGLNTIAGDLGTFLQNDIAASMFIRGNNVISGFTTPVSSNLDTGGSFQLIIEGNNDLTGAEIDALLIFIDSITLGNTSRIITILGNSLPRTSASDAAYTSLTTTKGFTITLNT